MSTEQKIEEWAQPNAFRHVSRSCVDGDVPGEDCDCPNDDPMGEAHAAAHRIADQARITAEGGGIARAYADGQLVQQWIANEPARIAEAERRGAVEALRRMAGDTNCDDDSDLASSRADAISDGSAAV